MVVCRFVRLSVRAGGAGESTVAFNGGDSGGGIEPYEKDMMKRAGLEYEKIKQEESSRK
jgi:hypothetical protein